MINKIYVVYEGDCNYNVLYPSLVKATKRVNRTMLNHPTRNPRLVEYDLNKEYKFYPTYSKGETIMKIENYKENQEVWITIKDGINWDGPHRRLATNKAKITKYFKNNYISGEINPHEHFKDCKIQKFILKYKYNKWNFVKTKEHYQITNYDNNKLIMSTLKLDD